MRVEGVGLRVDLASGVSAAPVGIRVDAVRANVVRVAGPERRGAHQRRLPLPPNTTPPDIREKFRLIKFYHTPDTRGAT